MIANYKNCRGVGKAFRPLALAACLSFSSATGLFPTMATANDNVGLWVGTATINGVSQVHKSTPDLAFDLALTGLKTSSPLLAFKSGGWEYNKTYSFENHDWATGSGGDGWIADQNAPLYANPQSIEDSTGVQMEGDGNAAYFRRTFQVVDPSAFSELRLKLRVEDGAAVYLNGRSIFRANLPSGDLTSDSTALSDVAREKRLIETALPASALTVGENLIAVEVHAFNPDQGVFYFDMELTGSALMAEEALVPSGASGWKYAAPENPNYSPTADDEQNKEQHQMPSPDGDAKDWKALGYADNGWNDGQTKPDADPGFGYAPDSATRIGFNTAVWPRTIYFRRAFTPSSVDFDQLRLELRRDDGAVVYLNGAEIMRSNMPAGIIEYKTSPVQAVGPSDEGRYVVEVLDGMELLDGENVLAVEIHQHPSELGDPDETSLAVTPSPSNFNLRVMLHSDSAGDVNLLKEVYSMSNQNGDAALLASDELIPNYKGPGRRISTAAYDFDGDVAACVSGAVSKTGLLMCEITLPANHPTNPFLHRYHPDHDNWDARYEKHFPEDKEAGAPEESFEVTRTIKLSFEEKYPPGCQGESCRQYPPPSWGYSSLGGLYEETFTGLHRDQITVTGTFKLDRVSTVGQLEQ